MLHRIDEEEGFLKQVCFSAKSFHMSGYLNHHNMRIWCLETLRETIEIEKDNPKLNVSCGLMHNRIIVHFLVDENTVNGGFYLNMLQLFALSQLEN
ncbi:uncharacterized protein NPIL_80571 [Nephila pilipes]|uniref:Uncharacterized protein n=1 Tax=Nephila pilipes TaxID=299642 RepID=A0A8X6UWU8_NEPPI|nr:uncharacterized protein NPIL_80571 [Nephila pilipes]